MISFELGVEDLADTRFALSPLGETVLSLRVLREPGLSAVHLPWRRSVLGRLGALDTALLMSLVAQRRTLPDFLTPRPASFAPDFEAELAAVRATSPDTVRRDLLAAHAPDPLPDPLSAADRADDAAVEVLRDDICDLLRSYWEAAVRPAWPRMRLLLEADMTYRARQLAVGGARRLFADMHPNLRWNDGVLHIGAMINSHRVAASGRGLLLLPSVFVHKPAPPVSPEEPPTLAYPSRGWRPCGPRRPPRTNPRSWRSSALPVPGCSACSTSRWQRARSPAASGSLRAPFPSTCGCCTPRAC